MRFSQIMRLLLLIGVCLLFSVTASAQKAQGIHSVDFSNFDYETGLNVLAGMQSRKGTFVELKTSLYSGPSPKLRVIVGYNF